MDRDLKSLLEEKAEEVRLTPRMPAAVLRRSRRRRVGTGVMAGVVALGVVAGAFAGTRLLLPEAAEPRQARPAGTQAGFYPFIFPTQEELDSTLAEVEDGSLPPSPSGTAVLFAMNVLGWDEDDVEVSVPGDEPIMAVITNPVLNEAAGIAADLRTAVFLARVPGSHDPPVYAVLAARAEDLVLEPVGPDEEFGTEGRIAFRGRVSFVPEGGSVILSVDRRPGAPVLVEADGRFEVEADIPSGAGGSTLLSVALLDRSGRTLALTSSRLATPVTGHSEMQGSAPAQVAPPQEIPRAVIDTQAAILDAAGARDWAALRDLIPNRGFTFSYGGERDPIAYWRKLESEGHVPLLGDILPMVLGTEPARLRGTYIWPAPAAEDPADWDQHDLDVLGQIHPQQDIRLFREIGLYTGWRVGIDRDGTWVFFVAGD